MSLTTTTCVDSAERRGDLRIFYRGWRPTRLGKLLNGALAGTGLGRNRARSVASDQPELRVLPSRSVTR
jgi:hypothetical protein